MTTPPKANVPQKRGAHKTETNITTLYGEFTKNTTISSHWFGILMSWIKLHIIQCSSHGKPLYLETAYLLINFKFIKINGAKLYKYRKYLMNFVHIHNRGHFPYDHVSSQLHTHTRRDDTCILTRQHRTHRKRFIFTPLTAVLNLYLQNSHRGMES